MKIIIRLLICIYIVAGAATFSWGYGNTESVYLWRLVNETRQNPALTLESLGVDVENMREQLGDRAWILDRTLPPLAMNERLVESSGNHMMDMVENLYFGYVSPVTGVSIEERIAGTGYRAKVVGENLGALSFDTYLDPYNAARRIFINMVKDELFAADPKYRIFSDVYTEIGITMDLAKLRFGEGEESRVYVVVMDSALPVEERAYIIGNVLVAGREGGAFMPEYAGQGFMVTFREVLFGSGVKAADASTLGAYQFEKENSYFMVLDALKGEGPAVYAENSFWGERGNELRDLEVSDDQ